MYSRSTTARAFSIPPSTNTPPKNSLHRVRKQGIALTPALILLATGKTQAIVKMQLARNDRQRGLVDEAGTQTRQLAFRASGKRANNWAETAISSTASPRNSKRSLCALPAECLVGPRTVRHREHQQRFVLETVSLSCPATHPASWHDLISIHKPFTNLTCPQMRLTYHAHRSKAT